MTQNFHFLLNQPQLQLSAMTINYAPSLVWDFLRLAQCYTNGWTWPSTNVLRISWRWSMLTVDCASCFTQAYRLFTMIICTDATLQLDYLHDTWYKRQTKPQLTTILQQYADTQHLLAHGVINLFWPFQLTCNKQPCTDSRSYRLILLSPLVRPRLPRDRSILYSVQPQRSQKPRLRFYVKLWMKAATSKLRHRPCPLASRDKRICRLVRLQYTFLRRPTFRHRTSIANWRVLLFTQKTGSTPRKSVQTI